jgi:ABC-2 type transport system ATP-binding protein
MSHLLEFTDVHRTYGRAKALEGVTFSVPAGGITALLGPNGAGKSTAMRAAVNLIKPTRGEIRILDTPSQNIGPEQLRQLGYVAEGMDLPLWMTVDQFLKWCRPFYAAWDMGLEDRLRKQFNLPGDRRLRNLSRGQRMKAALLSHLAYRPKLVLLDEPFSGLDPITRDEFISGLLELAEQEDWALLISSHDIEEVQKLADRVVMLQDGKVKLQEATDELLQRHRQVEVQLTDEAVHAPGLPRTWGAVKQTGRILRFIDGAFSAPQLDSDIRHHLPGAQSHSVEMLPLREVFSHVVKHVQNSTLA